MPQNLFAIAQQFNLEGNPARIKPFGSGHINDTFKVTTAGADRPDYILQRINDTVFPDVAGLMNNMDRVTRHIRHKLEEAGERDIDRRVLTLIPGRDGALFYKDAQGGYWRMLLFISGGKTYDIVNSPEKAYQGGRAFGRFQAQLSDFPPPPLKETIPDFHNLEKRLQTFERTVQADPVKRAGQVKEEIEMIRHRADEMSVLHRLGLAGKIPRRITHNDTKFNNILFDADDRVLCILDLDTVMPGFVHFDFGDAIRTCANTGAEDEKDLTKVSMDIKLFEAYARGFLEETGSFLLPLEIEYLAFSAKLFAYAQALRFLTDYIDGDHYYKIHFPEHNLQRTRAQLKLLQSMEEQYEDMKKIIKKMR